MGRVITSHQHCTRPALHVDLPGTLQKAPFYIRLVRCSSSPQVHVFGMVSLTQKLLPLLRQNKGRIVNVSSIIAVVSPNDRVDSPNEIEWIMRPLKKGYVRMTAIYPSCPRIETVGASVPVTVLYGALLTHSCFPVCEGSYPCRSLVPTVRRSEVRTCHAQPSGEKAPLIVLGSAASFSQMLDRLKRWTVLLICCPVCLCSGGGAE
jgi:hypothetical protein